MWGSPAVKFGNGKGRASVIDMRHRIEFRLWWTRPVILILAAVWSLSAFWADPSAAEDKLADQLKGKSRQEQVQYLMKEQQNGRNDPEIDFFLGVAMYSLGKLDSALVCFSNAVGKDSTYTKAYVNLGIVLDAQREPLKAEAMYKRAIELDPRDELALCHLGFFYYSRQQFGRAMDYYRQALAVNPQSAQAHYDLGLAFADAKIFKEAILEWEAVVKLNPDGELGKTAADNVRLIKQYLDTNSP
jgi:tetratricopeptide (TPR) repeat protein